MVTNLRISIYPYIHIQGAYKLSEYFAKLDDRCILCNENVHTTFGSTSQEGPDVQIAVGTRVEPPQIPGHTNYDRSVRQQFPLQQWFTLFPRDGSGDYRTIPNVSSLCVIDANFTILRQLLFQLWHNEIYNHPVLSPCTLQGIKKYKHMYVYFCVTLFLPTQKCCSGY
jgi:hypothetical protein